MNKYKILGSNPRLLGMMKHACNPREVKTGDVPVFGCNPNISKVETEDEKSKMDFSYTMRKRLA